jgi:chitinase
MAVDWEHPKTAVEGANFVLLLRDLRWAMPEDSYLLTTALPIGVYCLQHIILSDVGKIVNFLNLMCYDFHGDWTSVSGHHAQLCGPRHDGKSFPPPAEKSCTSGVDYVISRGLPPSKILLGVPVYARYFQQATGPREKFVGAGEMEYNDIPSEWISSAEIDEVAGAASVVDDRDQEGSADGGGGGKGFVSFDVPATVTMKAKLVKARGLGGLFYWTAAGDRNDGESLVLAGYKELQLSIHRQVNGGW